MMKHSKLTILILLVCTVQFYAQQNDAANQLLEKVKKNFSRVQDYSVKAKIKVDVDFLKVPETEAELLFVAPDKVKINSEGFAMLPKQGLNFSPLSLLKSQYAAFLERNENYEGNECAVIKVVPMGNTGDILLSTLWVDKKNELIRKVESTTRNSGTFNILLHYDNNMVSRYPLPSAMKFTFDINKTSIPKSFTGQQEDERRPSKKNKLTKGTVEIYYSNYKINTGKIKIDSKDVK